MGLLCPWLDADGAAVTLIVAIIFTNPYVVLHLIFQSYKPVLALFALGSTLFGLSYCWKNNGAWRVLLIFLFGGGALDLLVYGLAKLACDLLVA